MNNPQHNPKRKRFAVECAEQSISLDVLSTTLLATPDIIADRTDVLFWVDGQTASQTFDTQHPFASTLI